MTKVREPFKAPLIRMHKAMSRRWQPGNDDAQDRAVLEVLDAPEMEVLLDMLAPAEATGKRGRGRPTKLDARFYLVWMITSIVLALDTRAARNRVLNRNRLR